MLSRMDIPSYQGVPLKPLVIPMLVCLKPGQHKRTKKLERERNDREWLKLPVSEHIKLCPGLFVFFFFFNNCLCSTVFIWVQ